jgi:transcriptional regulator with XRE-family HTH domain
MNLCGFCELARMDIREQEQIIKSFGENLKRVRLEKELSLRQLAHLADMSHNGIHEIEKGIANPSLTTIITLARALGVEPAALISFSKPGSKQ